MYMRLKENLIIISRYYLIYISNIFNLSLLRTISTLNIIFIAGINLTVAQWSSNPSVNTPICILAEDQLEPDIVSDGSDGAIITWYDRRTGTDFDLYAQRINEDGIAQWTENGVPICVVAGNGPYPPRPTIISDSEGGAIITWHDLRNGLDYDIYAQKINSAGIIQWAMNGVAICTSVGKQVYPKIISDGSGGAIITWDFFDPPYDIYAQRINSAGIVQWVANGVAICTAPGPQREPSLIQDEGGGAIITWNDNRSNLNDIYAQHINASGVVQWLNNGTPICMAVDNQHSPVLVSDGAAGAIITWYDDRLGSTNSDIYAQRINAAGNIQWTIDGVAITTAMQSQVSPTITSDGLGGAIITWNSDSVFVQLINNAGNVMWDINGIGISPGSASRPKIEADGAGGAIITWIDQRAGNFDIYAQRISNAGNSQWTLNGVSLCTALEGQYVPLFISDELGGAIITWFDYRNGSSNSDIYTQNVCPNGTIGTCSGPEINVEGNDANIIDGDTTPSFTDSTDFGNIIISNSLTNNFIIRNTGVENLSIGSILMTGPDSNLFILGQLNPSSPIQPNNYATFSINFMPTTTGLKMATVNINSNDENEGNYDFLIQGTGIYINPDTSAVGIGTTSPASSSVLDVESTTRGILIPRMTTEERMAIPSPAEGLLVYDHTLHCFYYFNGSLWKKFLAE